MAYKFQLGSAVLSGSTKFEEQLDAAGGIKLTVPGEAMVVGDDILFQDSDGLMKREGVGDFMTLVAGDGLGVASSQLKIKVDDSTIETDSDSIRIKDGGVVTAKIADNNVTLAKMAGLARGKFIIGDSSGDPSALALGSAAQFLVSDGDDLIYRSLSGDATMNAAGALTISADAVEGSMLNDNVISGQTELAHADIASADELMISDGGSLKKVGLDSLRDHYFGQVSGDATVADGGALTIGTGVVEHAMLAGDCIDGDNIQDDVVNSEHLAAGAIDTEHLADNQVTLAKMAGITRGSIISGDASGDPQALAVGSAHQFLQSDGTDLAYVSMSGDATLVAGVLSIGATKVTDAMINDDVAVTLAGVGLSAASGVLALAASELSDAAVASGDKFVFEDATDSSTKKESIDDIATFLAGGDGLSASSGVISHPNSAIANKDFSSTVTLSVGYNVPDGTSMGGAVVANMPTPAVGAKVTVKAPGDCSQTNTVTIQGATMDGVTSLVLEGPGASVTLICNNSGSDSWVIV